ncbi:MAG: DUF11 domain-containing protein [Anaerolineae bacterium]|nr:DUF11 domain-containing protein [Anaerolineae bacterium]
MFKFSSSRLSCFVRGAVVTVLLVFFMLAVLTSATPVQAHPLGATAAEIASLTSLYNALGGPGWTNNSNWLVGDPCINAWHGLTCDGANTNVLEIYLYGNHLAGDIGLADLSGLVNLTNLNLSDNQIVGDIADLHLDQNTNLRLLGLGRNRIGGDIANLDIDQNLALLDLVLGGNPIVGNIADPDLHQNTSLQRLDLRGTQIGGDIAGLNLDQNSALLDLWLDNNQIGGNIAGLDLDQNSALQRIGLGRNQIGGNIADLDLSQQTALEYLVLSHNRIGGNIADLDLTNNIILATLVLGENQIGGNIENLDITHNTALEDIYLERNQIGGNIAGLNLSNNIALLGLYVASNAIGGDAAALNLTNNIALRVLDLEHNQIGGNIDGLNLSRNITLDNLLLAHNQIGGDISGLDLTNNAALVRITLYNNQIGGDLAGFDLSHNIHLWMLRLSNNRFDGTVPDLTATGLDDDPHYASLWLCGGANIVRPSGNPAIDIFAETYDEFNWTAAYGCVNPLRVSAVCNGTDLAVNITEGNNPFNITGTGSGLPQTGVGLGATTLVGPGSWTGITIVETTGDMEQRQLGDFTCPAPARLAATATCQGANLQIAVTGGDAPLNITGTGPGLPRNSAGIGTTTVAGPGNWTGLVIAETAGDLEQLSLGDIACTQQPVPIIMPGGGDLAVFDPALSKSGSPLSAKIGEQVTYNLVVSNPHSQAINNVIVTDPIPPIFDVVDVATSRGTSSVSGQVVTVSIGTLQPGEQVTIAIIVQGNATAQPGQVCNVATAGNTRAEGCVTLMPTQLPATGGRPVQAVPLLWIATGVGVMVMGWTASRRIRGDYARGAEHIDTDLPGQIRRMPMVKASVRRLDCIGNRHAVRIFYTQSRYFR